MFQNRKLINRVMFVLAILMALSMVIALFGPSVIQ